MKRKINCWQFKNCGREKGGLMADILGECPVSRELKYDGLNGGRGAGRACWMVRGSGAVGGSRIECDRTSCHTCEFYRRIVYEEADQVQFRFSTGESKEHQSA